MNETRTARLEFLADQKIVAVRINAKATQTVQDAKQNLEAAIEMARNCKPKPGLLVDIRYCNPVEADVRHFYGSADLFPNFSVFALLVDVSPLGVMMGNIYFKVARLSIPSKLFMEEDKCQAWIVGKVK